MPITPDGANGPKQTEKQKYRPKIIKIARKTQNFVGCPMILG
jgi:hypothetical protein